MKPLSSGNSVLNFKSAKVEIGVMSEYVGDGAFVAQSPLLIMYANLNNMDESGTYTH